ILMGIISLGGLIFPEEFYQSDLLIQTFLTNDVINLVIGVPILLGSLWFTRRSNLTGLLIWPGALLFVIYNYLVYIIGLPLEGLTLVYLALVLLSAFNIYDILQRIDNGAVQDQLSGRVSEKLAAWFLIIFGILFILRALNMIIGTLLYHTGFPATEIGTLAADISVSILWIIGGYFLLRNRPLGYTSGLGLLFAASMLFIGLIIFLIIQPFLTTAPLSLMDIVVVAVMAIILSIPFALFLRGTIHAS
ncbi:MAG: hypothetical protein ACWGOY_08145, partial [Anaerolineales bacterium]